MTGTLTTAHRAGLAYLGLALSGLFGFLILRGQFYVPGDAVATAANLVEHEGLARLAIATDLLIVVTQSMAALYFFQLFRATDAFAAGSLAAFGFMNSVTTLVSVMFTSTALTVAVDNDGGSAAATSLLLYDLSDAAWGVGSLFFGLWLIPMGWLVLRSGFMPAPLGRLLIGGGFGYLISTFVHFLLPDASAVADVLTVPASVGEFWMIGYLLTKGVRSGALA